MGGGGRGRAAAGLFDDFPPSWRVSSSQIWIVASGRVEGGRAFFLNSNRNSDRDRDISTSRAKLERGVALNYN